MPKLTVRSTRSSKLVARIDAYERLVRLDKPIGTLLLLWPTLTALWIATAGAPSLDRRAASSRSARC